jgi:hypothetical protein
MKTKPNFVGIATVLSLLLFSNNAFSASPARKASLKSDASIPSSLSERAESEVQLRQLSKLLLTKKSSSDSVFAKLKELRQQK